MCFCFWQDEDFLLKIQLSRFYEGAMVMIWLRKLRNLRNLILNTEKHYWTCSSYSHARKKNLFLQFKVANKLLESSESYLSCQRRLLNQEIPIKHKTIRTLYNKITSMKNSLHNEMSFIDYVHALLQNF